MLTVYSRQHNYQKTKTEFSLGRTEQNKPRKTVSTRFDFFLGEFFYFQKLKNLQKTCLIFGIVPKVINTSILDWYR